MRPAYYDVVIAAQAGIHLGDVACLVLDVHLRQETGFQLYDQLVRAGNALPVVFITAYDEPQSRDAARCAGAHAYLVKPFMSETFLTAIVNAVRR